MANSGTREKIVILGGGISAMTTAFELTDQLDWQEKYDISVYQLGWRLGGKGASGRDSEGRIIEHGLHLWFGFYDNAFNLMKRCFSEYQRLGLYPDSPIRSVNDAFAPQEYYEYDEYINGAWLPWSMPFKVTPNVFPGDDDRLLTLTEAIMQVINEMREAIMKFIAGSERADSDMPLQAGTHGGDILEEAHDTAANLHEALVDAPLVDNEHDNILTSLLKDFLNWFEKEIKKIEGELSTEMRRLKLLIEMAYYHLKGILEDGVLFSSLGLEALNDQEYTQWLQKHGAPPELLTSALIRGLYDCAFCFRDGQPGYETRNVAAGTATYGVLRMFLTYQGAVFFKMNAGMGDTIFAPLYAVLKARGVKFHFFSKVTNLRLTDDKAEIAAIEFAQQATPKNGDYDPLFNVKDLPCWPNEPFYDQLLEGEQMQAMNAQGINVDLESFWTAWQDVGSFTLRAGVDFDKVVLGITLGALPHTCADLIAANADWQAMVANVPTVWTRQYELWMGKSADALGTTKTNPLAMAYAEPGDVWTEMSHLLPREDWKGPFVPTSIYYIGSSMPTPKDADIPPASDHDFPKRALELAFAPMANYINNNAGLIWPAGTLPDQPNTLDPLNLFAADNVQGMDRLWAQDIRANINPTDRHAIAIAGSWRHKLAPGDSKFRRLYLTGDWTYVGILSFGCVEGAAISGMLCSKAISGYPEKVIQ
jgi:uncharacterized protein with NAD-binding domain and iron-sulfur cluster